MSPLKHFTDLVLSMKTQLNSVILSFYTTFWIPKLTVNGKLLRNTKVDT